MMMLLRGGKDRLEGDFSYQELMRKGNAPNFEDFLRGLREHEAGRGGAQVEGLQAALQEARRADMYSRGTSASFGQRGAELDGQGRENHFASPAEGEPEQDIAAARM